MGYPSGQRLSKKVKKRGEWDEPDRPSREEFAAELCWLLDRFGIGMLERPTKRREEYAARLAVVGKQKHKVMRS